MTARDLKSLYLGGRKNGRIKSEDKNLVKFNKVAKLQHSFDEVMERLRGWTEDGTITRDSVSALGGLIIMETGIRVGNKRSAEGFASKAKHLKDQILKTYGLMTLLHEHVSFKGNVMVMDFVGKKNVQHRIEVRDPATVKFARLVWEQNHKVFLSWKDDKSGEEDFLTHKKFFNFIRQNVNKLTPKDLRTFRANVEAAKISNDIISGKKKSSKMKSKDIKAEIKSIIKQVATTLGNTGSASEKYYINPDVIAYHLKRRGYEQVVIKKNGKKRKKLIPIGSEQEA